VCVRGCVAGRWTRDEHAIFLQCLREFGRDWKRVAAAIPSRTVVQIRTHAQKHFMKMVRLCAPSRVG
jgi:SHAQKYF class myb-like DNA-binding protein